MKRLWLIGSAALAALLISLTMAYGPNDAPQTQTIPLDQIWAYEMPGTRDVRELEPDHFGERTRELPSKERFRLLSESLTEQLRRALKSREPPGANAEPGFAVLGKGLEALRAAHQVLVEELKWQKSFPEDSEISVVFFSYLCGKYVRLESVERRNNTISIRYRFVPHMTKNMSSHFAIIPLGKLPLGKYQVEIVQLPMERQPAGGDKYVSNVRVRQILCQPFSFSVAKR